MNFVNFMNNLLTNLMPPRSSTYHSLHQQNSSGLHSIESEINVKKLLFLGRLITEIKMASAVKSLFLSRVGSFFETRYPALGVLPSICKALQKYYLFHHFKLWHSKGIFHSYNNWKLLMKSGIRGKEISDWKIFCADHPNMQITQAVFDHLTPSKIWSITDHYPDLVSRLHVQIRLMGNFGLNATVQWLRGPTGALCFICKEGLDDFNYFLWECKALRKNFQSVWSNLVQTIDSANPTNGLQISSFVRGLNHQHQTLLLIGGIPLPFHQHNKILVKKFLCTMVGKIYRITKTMLSEFGAPWLKSYFV